jgi:hypothetical protein
MEWRELNEGVEMYELVNDEGRQVAVAYKRSGDHWDGKYGYVTEIQIAGNPIFETMEEAQRAAIVAYITMRIEA